MKTPLLLCVAAMLCCSASGLRAGEERLLSSLHADTDDDPVMRLSPAKVRVERESEAIPDPLVLASDPQDGGPAAEDPMARAVACRAEGDGLSGLAASLLEDAPRSVEPETVETTAADPFGQAPLPDATEGMRKQDAAISIQFSSEPVENEADDAPPPVDPAHVDALEADLAAARKRLEAAEEELRVTKDALEAARPERLEACRKRLAAAEEENAGLKRDLDETRTTLEAVAAALARRGAELDKVTEARDTALREAAAYRSAAQRKMAELHYNLGVLFQKNERYPEAEREYLDGLKFQPDDPDIRYNLAILYDEHLRDKEKAIVQYKAFLRLRPDGQEARAVREWLLMAEGDARYQENK